MMIKKFVNKLLKRLPIVFFVKIEKVKDGIWSVSLFDIR